eukprot:TRINITY_DN15711_c0_g1_i2.p2 TRINITY_DN15711_c0_g1~~TRINITY_DN15711_c0_g1_i2.p2  ORF type:complete len:127 (-),score=18.97 TRINITY_DN15711_c0_g1_i2:90-470(-)
MIENIPHSADFCQQCGNILELPLASNYIECQKCGYKQDVATYQSQIIVSKKEYKEKKQWLEQYNQEFSSFTDEQESNIKGAKVKQECPNCQYGELYFYTMQLRSADEGQTIFYECPKCGHKYTQNT